MDQSPETGEKRSDGGSAAGVAAGPSLPLLAPARPERADAVRNRASILCAAERLVSQQGVAGVTMDEVACAAGVGKGTLFRRFGDRSGLLRALLDQRERAFQEEFIRGPAPLGPGVPACQRLLAFGERWLEEVEVQGEILQAAEAGAPGERLVHSVYGAHRAHVRALLLDAAPDLDVEYTADVLLGALTAELVIHQRRSLGMPLQRLKDGWVALVEGVLAAGAAREQQATRLEA